LASLAIGLFATLAVLAVGINAQWLASLDVSVAEWFAADRSATRHYYPTRAA